ncbi:MAG: hypothetical protein H6633_05075 [Anaerolineales bacterium]|nr:hypothetical protein [Anaerolineales bacterium]
MDSVQFSASVVHPPTKPPKPSRRPLGGGAAPVIHTAKQVWTSDRAVDHRVKQVWPSDRVVDQIAGSVEPFDRMVTSPSRVRRIV